MESVASIHDHSLPFYNSLHINILVVPVGHFPSNIFDQYIQKIRENEYIELEEIHNRVIDCSNISQQGFVLARFHTIKTWEFNYGQAWEDYYPSKKIYAIIGLIYCPSNKNIQSSYQGFISFCDQNYSNVSIQRCFAVEPEDTQYDVMDESAQDLILIPNQPSPQISFYLSTLIQDLVVQILKFIHTEWESLNQGHSDSISFLSMDLSTRIANGRKQKKMGDLSLLMGNIRTATSFYLASTEIVQPFEDLLWQSGALFGLGICQLLLSLTSLIKFVSTFQELLEIYSNLHVLVPWIEVIQVIYSIYKLDGKSLIAFQILITESFSLLTKPNSKINNDPHEKVFMIAQLSKIFKHIGSRFSSLFYMELAICTCKNLSASKGLDSVISFRSICQYKWLYLDIVTTLHLINIQRSFTKNDDRETDLSILEEYMRLLYRMSTYNNPLEIYQHDILNSMLSFKPRTMFTIQNAGSIWPICRNSFFVNDTESDNSESQIHSPSSSIFIYAPPSSRKKKYEEKKETLSKYITYANHGSKVTIAVQLFNPFSFPIFVNNIYPIVIDINKLKENRNDLVQDALSEPRLEIEEIDEFYLSPYSSNTQYLAFQVQIPSIIIGCQLNIFNHLSLIFPNDNLDSFDLIKSKSMSMTDISINHKVQFDSLSLSFLYENQIVGVKFRLNSPDLVQRISIDSEKPFIMLVNHDNSLVECISFSSEHPLTEYKDDQLVQLSVYLKESGSHIVKFHFHFQDEVIPIKVSFNVLQALKLIDYFGIDKDEKHFLLAILRNDHPRTSCVVYSNESDTITIDSHDTKQIILSKGSMLYWNLKEKNALHIPLLLLNEKFLSIDDRISKQNNVQIILTNTDSQDSAIFDDLGTNSVLLMVGRIYNIDIVMDMIHLANIDATVYPIDSCALIISSKHESKSSTIRYQIIPLYTSKQPFHIYWSICTVDKISIRKVLIVYTNLEK